ncbi:MAG TPA: cadherin domain-containing protein, partial [Pirellulaceae bacterium]|nr:cadherin domain-containing protein [Pirellulaceae bacterium]
MHVTNIGSAALTGTLSLGGAGASAWSFDGSATLSLSPGASRDIRVTLSTATRGRFDATLSIAHNASASPYTVALTGAVVPAPDAFEPNNGIGSATDLGQITNWRRDDLTLHNGSDEDWYRFSVPSTGILDIAATFAASEGDLDFTLYDANGGVLAASTTRGDTEAASVNVPGGVPLYLRVYSRGDGANVYSLMLAHTPTNEAPTDVWLDVDTTRENSDTTSGPWTVGTLHAADPNLPDDAVSFTLTAGAGDDDNGQFEIVGGVLRFRQGTTLDFESQAQYQLRVRATDAAGLGYDESLVVHLTDVNEYDPRVASARFSVRDTAAAGATVGRVQASDADTAQSVRFAIVGGNADGAFAIDAATGELTVRVAGLLDGVSSPQRTLTIRAVDSGTPARSGEATVTIDVLSAPGAVIRRTGQRYGTIQQAINASASGDVIDVADGFYDENLFVDRNITIQAVHDGQVVIDGPGMDVNDGKVIQVTSSATFIGLHLQNAHNGIYQRDVGAHVVAKRMLVSNVLTAFIINNSGGNQGTFDVSNSTIVDSYAGLAINDGGTIVGRNLILSNVQVAYGAWNAIAIIPDHNLLDRVGQVASGGGIQADPAQLIGDPHFRDPINGDYRLAAGSPAIDTGMFLGDSFLGAAPD